MIPVWRTLAEIEPGGALVPTMGALHAGHQELIRQAKAETGRCTVSVFVNPTQFGPSEDFERYPRDLDRDVALAAEAGADAVFAPEVAEMYPYDALRVRLEHPVTSRWEGASRPGHFDGVATVVAKLFAATRPEAAYFGLKDLQQCQVVRLMAEELRFPLRLEWASTVREPDGLAMSSRNRYLSPAERQIAPLLRATLVGLRQQINAGVETDVALDQGRNALDQAGFRVDYLETVTLPLMNPAKQLENIAATIVAAKLGTTRLIDNDVW